MAETNRLSTNPEQMNGSDSLRFSCPWCSQHIECDMGWAGVVLPCPACGKNMTAPGAPASTVKVLPRPLAIPEASARTTSPPKIPELANRAKLKKLQRRATFSLAAPLVTWVLSFVYHQTPAAGIVALFALPLWILGFISGIIAFIGLQREQEQAQWKAILGTCLNGF